METGRCEIAIGRKKLNTSVVKQKYLQSGIHKEIENIKIRGCSRNFVIKTRVAIKIIQTIENLFSGL